MSLLKDQNKDPLQKRILKNLMDSGEGSPLPLAKLYKKHKGTPVIKGVTHKSANKRKIGKIKELSQTNELPFGDDPIQPTITTPPSLSEFDDTISDETPAPSKPAPARSAPAQAAPQMTRESFSEDLKREVEAEIQAYREEQLKAAESEKQAILDKAYEEGLEKGKKESKEQVKEQVSELMNAINESVKIKNHFLQEASTELIDLSLKIAEKIIGHEVNTNKELCIKFISEALIKLTDKDHVVIKGHYDDIQYLKTKRDYFETEFKDIKHIEFQEDSHMVQGGFIIDTKLGYVDASIETKLDIIKKVLDEIYEENPDSLKMDYDPNSAPDTLITTQAPPTNSPPIATSPINPDELINEPIKPIVPEIDTDDPFDAEEGLSDINSFGSDEDMMFEE